MGCHTWFYTKDTVTLEQALDIAKSYYQQVKDAKRGKKARKANPTLAPDWDLNKFDERRGCYRAFLDVCEDDLRRGKLCVINEKGIFLGSDEYHDLFRIHTYPADELYSLEATLEFIDRHGIDEVDWDRLDEFWRKYPDGLIEFG